MRLSYRTTIIYALSATLWILLSDQILLLFSKNLEFYTFYSSFKGMLFILVTGIVLFILINRDINQRNAIILDLDKSLLVKEQINRELHHRIKNNLQVVISLLELDGEKGLTEESKDRLISRLLSMTSVYNVVYNSEKMARISLRSILEEYKAVSRKSMEIGSLSESDDLTLEDTVNLLLIVDGVLETLENTGDHGMVTISSGEGRSLRFSSDLGGASTVDLSFTSDIFLMTLLHAMKAEFTAFPGVPPAWLLRY